MSGRGIEPGNGLGIERGIGRALGIATLASVVLVAVGVAGMIATQTPPLDRAFPPFEIGRLPADVAAFKPAGFLWLGLLAVILTPSVRVVASLAGFAALGDRRMTAVALVILGVICLSAFLGAGG